MLTPLAIGQPLAAAASAGCSPSTFSAGAFSAAAISNGTLYMWGSNTVGQLGIGSLGGAGRSTPLPVVTSTGLVSPAAAWTSGVTSFAVDGSGQLWGWGDNHFGELGQPTSTVYFTSPIQITGPTNVVQVSGNGGNTMALTAGGAVWGWGFSPTGELGFVKPTPQTTPIVLPGLSNIAEISDGSFTSVALDANGTVFGSGQNMAGELGLGSGVTQVTAYRPLPGLSTSNTSSSTRMASSVRSCWRSIRTGTCSPPAKTRTARWATDRFRPPVKPHSHRCPASTPYPGWRLAASTLWL